MRRHAPLGHPEAINTRHPEREVSRPLERPRRRAKGLAAGIRKHAGRLLGAATGRVLLLLAFLAAGCGPAVVVADPQPTRAVEATPTSPLTAATPTHLPTAIVEPTATTPQVEAPSPTPPPSPTPVSEATPSPTPIPEIELLFTGDINPGRCVYARSKAAGDLTLPYQGVAHLLQAADIAIGSLDGSLSDFNPPPPCVETHRNLMAPTEAVQGLQYAGFDVITVATNHSKDCGIDRGCVNESMFETLDTLRGAGIWPVGAGANLAEATAPAIVTVEGVRFAFIGVSGIAYSLWASEDQPGTAPLQTEVYLEAIRLARQQADVVIVLPHWGREYSAEITYEQLNAAGRMVEAGAALVVGNHPHRVQGVETFPNGAVAAYALGNFVFDQTWSDGTLYTIQGVMLRARFRGPALEAVELIPVHIYDDMQPRLAEGEEAEQILQAVADSWAASPRR